MYTAKDHSALLGTEGFSEELLKNHFTLYEGYVKNTNTLVEKLRSGIYQAGTPEYNELTRRFGWEWNGMRLHELYFGNMIKGGVKAPEHSPLCKKIEETWGHCDSWAKDFKSTGGLRGIGWVVLAYDKESDRLFNTWIDEHDSGHLSGAKPLLVMDVFEHAFMLDYGLKKTDYVNAFWKAINWDVVIARLDA